jgi:esterase/lipase
LLAKWAQAQATLVGAAANAHTETAAAHEASLQAKVEAAQEVKHVKDTLARQAEKEVNSLKKKLEAAQHKAKDVADNLQAIVDGTLVWALGVVFLSP